MPGPIEAPRPIEVPHDAEELVRLIALPGCTLTLGDPVAWAKTKTNFVCLRAEAAGILLPIVVENGQRVSGGTTIGFIRQKPNANENRTRTSKPNTMTLLEVLQHIDPDHDASWTQLVWQLRRAGIFARCTHYFFDSPNQKITLSTNQHQHLMRTTLPNNNSLRPRSEHREDNLYVSEVARHRPGVVLHPEFWVAAQRSTEGDQANFVWSRGDVFSPRTSSHNPSWNHYVFGIYFEREDVERIWPPASGLRDSSAALLGKVRSAMSDLSAVPVDDVLAEIKRRMARGNQSPLMPLRAAARKYGMHEDTMLKYGKQFGFATKLGGKWMIDTNALETYLQSQ